MRLNEEYQNISEQLSDLYQCRRILEQKINSLEFRLRELDRMIDYTGSLDTSFIEAENS